VRFKAQIPPRNTEIGRACALYRPQLTVILVLFVVGMQDAKIHCPATKVSGKKEEAASKPRGLSGLHHTASFSTSRASPVCRFGSSTRLAAGGPYNKCQTVGATRKQRFMLQGIV